MDADMMDYGEEGEFDMDDEEGEFEQMAMDQLAAGLAGEGDSDD